MHVPDQSTEVTSGDIVNLLTLFQAAFLKADGVYRDSAFFVILFALMATFFIDSIFIAFYVLGRRGFVLSARCDAQSSYTESVFF